ncbi:hypothetical protein PFISCL1PPCAC_5253, partial [Pristionchus fissidentatus]
MEKGLRVSPTSVCKTFCVASFQIQFHFPVALSQCHLFHILLAVTSRSGSCKTFGAVCGHSTSVRETLNGASHRHVGAAAN